MKISVVISSYWIDDEKPQLLKKCVDSLKGADEILTLVTFPKAPLSFTEAHNRIAKLATGDYIIVVGDNATLVEGDLKDLCIPNTVTVPLINSVPHGPSGIVIYCFPKNIYEELGLYDPAFGEGSHWEDTDLLRNLNENNVEIQTIESVNFYKPSNSRTIQANENFEQRRQRNMDLYFKKWGNYESSTVKMRLEADRKFNEKLYSINGVLEVDNTEYLDNPSEEEKIKRNLEALRIANEYLSKLTQD